MEEALEGIFFFYCHFQEDPTGQWLPPRTERKHRLGGVLSQHARVTDKAKYEAAA